VTEPRVVLQAHQLRTRACTAALLHGTTKARVRRSPVSALLASTVFAAVIVVAIVVTIRITSVLHSTGH
jgi:hypothetical protein